MRSFERLGFEQRDELFGIDAQHVRRLCRPHCCEASRLSEQHSRPPEYAASSQTLQRLARAGFRLERVFDHAPHHDEDIVGGVAGGINPLAGGELRSARERRDAL